MFSFDSDPPQLAQKWKAALDGLAGNCRQLLGYDRPVLIEGGNYPGIWLECGPLESAIYAAFDPQIAIDSHRVFFHHQRDDGYLPCWIWADQIGASQIQMVVPIAATAWEVYQQVGDDAFLLEAYEACCRWDEWLVRYRDTLGSGLCEAFCEYDTGHDNSPRFAGLPHRARDGDARWCPDVGELPYIAPDLSATVYGGRIALAAMAQELKKPDESQGWTAKAQATRQRLIATCYDEATSCFYDRDKNGELVRIRGDALTRVLSEHVVSQEVFEVVYQRQIRNPDAFWTPYPLPSIAADDPAFVKTLPPNSWGGASQALTALRTPRWFGHYGKHADHTMLMRRWVSALLADDGFRQQMNPWTGAFIADSSSYSPAMLVFVDFVRRLAGPYPFPGHIEWNCGLLEGLPATQLGSEAIAVHTEGSRSNLILKGKQVAVVQGSCRVVTDLQGRLKAIIAADPQPQTITLKEPGDSPRTAEVQPDQIVSC